MQDSLHVVVDKVLSANMQDLKVTTEISDDQHLLAVAQRGGVTACDVNHALTLVCIH